MVSIKWAKYQLELTPHQLSGIWAWAINEQPYPKDCPYLDEEEIASVMELLAKTYQERENSRHRLQ